MKHLQPIFEECLRRLSNGTATLDECLVLYPKHSKQLKPLLDTAFLLNSGRGVRPLPTFSAFGRFALIQYARSHPRQLRRGIALSWRMAVTLAMLFVALLVTGTTVHAQSALPGDIDYGWKRTTEMAWRALARDQLAADIILAERRLDEWLAVANDPVLSIGAMNSYQEALSRLESRDDAEALAHIVPVLQSHEQNLKNAGLPTSVLDNYLAEMLTPVVIPVTGAQPVATEVPAIATDVPTEIAAGACVPNSGVNCASGSNGNGRNNEKDKKEKDKEKKDKENNGKGPK